MGKRIDRKDFKFVELTFTQLKELLTGFEQKYRMDSKDFYRKYNRGELDESNLDDFMDWATYYEWASDTGTRRSSVA